MIINVRFFALTREITGAVIMQPKISSRCYISGFCALAVYNLSVHGTPEVKIRH